MPRLPRPLQEVVRDRPFRISGLGLFDECLLRLGLDASRSPAPVLAPGPWADFGTAVHVFLERRATPSKADWNEFIKALLSGDITGRSIALGDQEVPLTAILPAESLLRRIGRLRTRLARRRRMDATSKPSCGPDVSLEERIEGAKGELVGRIDRLERWPDNRWIITDLKSGPLRKAGELRSDYVTQISAYAFLLDEREGPARIDVKLVGPDGEWSARFSADLRKRVKNVLEELGRRLPRGVSRPAEDLASPGRVCRTCRYRPVCGRYLAEAPRSWRHSTGAYPLDRWGVVERIEPREGRLEVLLRGPLHGLTLVAGIPGHLVPADLQLGDRVWFFHLRRTRGSSGTCFHVLDPERPLSSAHRLSFFHEPRQGR